MISNDRIRDRVVVAYAKRMDWVDDIRSYEHVLTSNRDRPSYHGDVAIRDIGESQ